LGTEPNRYSVEAVQAQLVKNAHIDQQMLTSEKNIDDATTHAQTFTRLLLLQNIDVLLKARKL
jgi:hypothetical protein